LSLASKLASRSLRPLRSRARPIGASSLEHEDPQPAAGDPLLVLQVAAVHLGGAGQDPRLLVVGGGSGGGLDGAPAIGDGGVRIGLEVEHPGRRRRLAEVRAQQGEGVVDRDRDQV